MQDTQGFIKDFLKGTYGLTRLHRHTVAVVVIWTLIVAGSLVWNIHHERHQTHLIAASSARAHFDKDQAFRFWAASHGGVYVPATERTPPNPYLAHIPDRDITTPSGKHLTLMNPAYMIRQLMTDFASLYGVTGRITSLKPLRPENAPDEWERSALRAFEGGEKELFEITEIEGVPYLRLMRPMFVKKPCLKCHGFQGYKEGDIKGGVGITVPMAPYMAHSRNHTKALTLSHVLIWLLGLGAIGFVYLRGRDRALERKGAVEALRESEEKFRAIATTATDAFIVMDSEGKIIYWNPAAEGMFGHMSAEALGRELHLFLAPEKYHEAYKEGFRRFRETGEGPAVGNTLEFLAIRKDGSEFPIEVSTSAINMKGVWHAVGIIRDITERKEGEEKLRQANEELQQAYETLDRAQASIVVAAKLAAVGRLTAGACHEILNPLNVILTRFHLMKSAPDTPPEVFRHIHVLEEQANRISKITKGLVYFSRQRPPRRQPLDVNDEVRSTLALVEHDLGLSNIDVELHLTEALPAVSADMDQLQQVVLNLLTNAIDAMPYGGRLSLKTEAVQANGQQYVELRVEDSGVGIAPEFMDKLFEPFFTTKTEGDGVGLGLAICHGIIEAHGGSIRAESNTVAGTTFIVQLPLEHSV